MYKYVLAFGEKQKEKENQGSWLKWGNLLHNKSHPANYRGRSYWCFLL